MCAIAGTTINDQLCSFIYLYHLIVIVFLFIKNVRVRTCWMISRVHMKFLLINSLKIYTNPLRSLTACRRAAVKVWTLNILENNWSEFWARQAPRFLLTSLFGVTEDDKNRMITSLMKMWISRNFKIISTTNFFELFLSKDLFLHCLIQISLFSYCTVYESRYGNYKCITLHLS